jgi:hypothetical protein
MKIISISLNLLYLISGLFTYLLNPGTIYRYGKNKKKKYCKECNYEYPFHKKLSHCYSCGICVIGIDHHCGVFGKCIARNNIFWFYSFIVSTFISIFTSIGTLVYIMAKLPI